MSEKEIFKNLLSEFKTLKPDLKKFDGDPAPAYAERLIKFINLLTPHANLFDDNFKTEIKKYIMTYQAAKKNEKGGENILKLVHPTTLLISKTLEEKVDGKDY